MDAEDEQSKTTTASFVKVDTELFFLGLEERLRAQASCTSTSKPISTRVTTSTAKSSRHTFKDEKVESHTDKNGVCYRVGGKRSTSRERTTFVSVDHVYLETNKQAEPYSIACVLDFRLVRGDACRSADDGITCHAA